MEQTGEWFCAVAHEELPAVVGDCEVMGLLRLSVVSGGNTDIYILACLGLVDGLMFASTAWC